MPEVLLFKNYSHVVYLWHGTVVKRKDIAATSKKFPNYRGFQSISITARINDIRPNTKSNTKSFGQSENLSSKYEVKICGLKANPVVYFGIHIDRACVFSNYISSTYKEQALLPDRSQP